MVHDQYWPVQWYCLILLHTFCTATALVRTKAIVGLKLGHCGMSASGTRDILLSLLMVTTMTVLDLSGNSVDMPGVKHLGR